MVKYTKLKQAEGSGDIAAANFAKNFRLDLIEVPEEFKDESIDDINIKRSRRGRRPVIRLRSSRDISKYDAWRSSDREFFKGSPNQPCIRKIMVSPASLVKTFGLPQISNMGFDVTGDYFFEDSNLDTYNIHDYRQTDFYHGLNREDEYYDKELRKPPH